MRLKKALEEAAMSGGEYPVDVSDLVGLYKSAGQEVPEDIASQEADADINVSGDILLKLNKSSKHPIALEM